ncbi:MAG TPA: efflux RND transporter periplasmic adaptor subunit [Sphaerochaeta sp.]|nr:MAG: efflux transporter periplasmic adaptor subunit [Spirochaetes bacterium GWC2_52_13]OHD62524.1 MAG: efflux transporter periplasmic adaptor subunit [Spirochaetes bacterium GWF2_52_7]HCJ94563.1 efflux RND transporter periplasmic adaptor subunit [Sphaerochaeta sp.]HCS37168.1 efflux RND transporter periplasmic adaptor subunit [Sphaerochaeta sp.]
MVGHRKYLAGILVVVLVLAVSCMKEEPQDVAVDTVSASTDYTQLVASAVEVKVAALRPTVQGSGVVQGRNEVVVKSRASGIVTSIEFDLGDTIDKDQVLVRIDDTIANLSLDQATRQVENARKEVDANTQLYERGAVSLSQLNQSKATLAGLEAQLARATDSVRDVVITSPLAGRVADRNAALVVGDSIQAGQTIGRIIDLQTLSISLSFGQSQIFLVREGAQARVVIDTPNETISTTGTVRAISAGSDARTGSWTVVVDFDNPEPDTIRAGISASVTIYNAEAPVYPLVPNAAMVNRDGRSYVYVLQDSIAKLVEVEVVDRYGDTTAVTSLDGTFELPGAKVLTSGLSRVTDGSAVVTQDQ